MAGALKRPYCFSGNPALPNPYGDPSLAQPLMPVQQLVTEILFVRTSYVKKIIEDCSNSEETVKLLRFGCWENPQFSSTVLSELLWQVGAFLPRLLAEMFDLSSRSSLLGGSCFILLSPPRWLTPTLMS